VISNNGFGLDAGDAACVAVGSRVEFLGFGEDDDSPLTPGTCGTVVFVDDVGTLHVQWDDGTQLGLIVDPAAGRPDRFRVIRWR
jgi:hypothetical protein